MGCLEGARLVVSGKCEPGDSMARNWIRAIKTKTRNRKQKSVEKLAWVID